MHGAAQALRGLVALSGFSSGTVLCQPLLNIMTGIDNALRPQPNECGAAASETPSLH
jgi:hypothetical protein